MTVLVPLYLYIFAPSVTAMNY